MKSSNFFSVARVVAVSATFWLSVPLFAQSPRNPARFDDNGAARGETVSITVENAPAKAGTTRISLKRSGHSVDLINVNYVPPPQGQTIGVASGVVPELIPLGDYEVAMIIDDRRYTPGTLSVHPRGVRRAHLNEFSPNHTYAIDTVYVPDRNAWEPASIEVVRLRLRDRFDTLDRQAIQTGLTDISWTDSNCASLPSPSTRDNPAVTPRVFGVMQPSGEVELCRVPKGQSVTFRGRELVS